MDRSPVSGVELVVHGAGKPAGSKRHIGQGRIVDANPNARDWQWRVAQVAGEQLNGRPLLEGPLRLDVCFYRTRPKSHLGTGRNAGTVKASAPAWPTTEPDLTKLVRAVEDALTGVCWRDDAQIVEQNAAKLYAAQVRCEIRVEDLDDPFEVSP
jgi:Holliday junction resolvase RusA-like endonuclease